jgi:hypothetical protein
MTAPAYLTAHRHPGKHAHKRTSKPNARDTQHTEYAFAHLHTRAQAESHNRMRSGLNACACLTRSSQQGRTVRLLVLYGRMQCMLDRLSLPVDRASPKRGGIRNDESAMASRAMYIMNDSTVTYLLVRGGVGGGARVWPSETCTGMGARRCSNATRRDMTRDARRRGAPKKHSRPPCAGAGVAALRRRSCRQQAQTCGQLFVRACGKRTMRAARQQVRTGTPSPAPGPAACHWA